MTQKKPKIMRGGRTKFKPQVRESSKRYLLRQAKDPYTGRARAAGYRARAAFKLLELDEKHTLLKPGLVVLDLGCAPGSWSQVAVEKGAKVVASDILEMAPVDGVTFIRGDFTEEQVWQEVRAAVGAQGADAVLSDMAPNTSGHQATDHLRSMALAELAADCALQLLKSGGVFVCKIFQGGEEKVFMDSLSPHFDKVSFAKPEASRAASKEMFIVGLGFKG
jgi:23S rRNA (uridine2552-2'-O)-methyltransferase